jgi:hypothetical protein
MCVPFIVILPGLLGLAVLPMTLVCEGEAVATGAHSYNEVLPLMLARYCGPGLMGLGITALIAGFMSGMAGNVTAFATVWTYDIYRPLAKAKSDAHYVKVGRWCTLLGVLVSIGTAYLVMEFKSIMDYVQALFSFFIAPLRYRAPGRLWRATPMGGFLGLLSGVRRSACGLVARPRGAAHHRALARRQGHGREHVPRSLELARVRDRHGRRESRHTSQERRRAGGAGLWRRRPTPGPDQARQRRRVSRSLALHCSRRCRRDAVGHGRT